MLRLATSLICLVAFPAVAQEQVTVEKVRGMVGLWRIEVPKGVGIGLFRKASFGPMRPIFCRIGEAGAIHCLNGRYSREGTVSLDRDGFHIAWGTMMARFVIDGTRDGEAITGRFAVKLSGISHDAPVPSTGARIAAGGAPAPELLTLLKSTPPPALAAFGAVEDAFYLGTSPRLDGGGDADYFRVYAVEFARGERVCGVHEASFTCV
jgi:hypothetical protein